MDVPYFENQPFYPKAVIGGENTYPIIVVESPLFRFELAESIQNAEPADTTPAAEETKIANAEPAETALAIEGTTLANWYMVPLYSGTSKL